MSFLKIEGKRFLLLGLGNRRSIAWHVGQLLEAEGAEVAYVVRVEERREQLRKLTGDRRVYVCDVREADQIEALAKTVGEEFGPLDGFLHSIAFADFSDGFRPFHETRREAFLEATQVSAFSLVEVANALRPHFSPYASVVAMGISSYVTAPTYGYLSPIKAALEGCVRFLAKSFSAESEVRFNAVNAGPLKTKASAGIPGYLENYLFAEQLTFRKRALTTEEVAATTVFLLSSRSSGINGQGIVVNAGLDWNYFDEEVVHKAMRTEGKGRA